jgi:hypothetical protein
MRIQFRYLAPLFAAAGVCASLVMAPAAAAAPECIDISPTTTQCETNGSSQIVTSPPVINNYPWFGWPYGGISISLGGWGW